MLGYSQDWHIRKINGKLSFYFSSICLKSVHIKKLGINIFVLEIFLQVLVDLLWGASLSLNSHTCKHRGHHASGYHSHLFLVKGQQCLTIYPTTCLSCPSLCHMNNDRSVDSSILNDRRSIVLTPSFTATIS